MSLTRRLVVALAAAVLASLAFASPAFAHIDPDPTEAQAGSQVSVGFTVEHGCARSPTVQLDMRLPDGTTSPVAQPPDGWTASIDGNVVTFIGGPLPADQELTFRVAMVLPPTPDTTIYFPFVQRCETGEIPWIAVPSDGSGDDAEQPAPAMDLVGPVATTTGAPTTAAPDTTAPAPATTTVTASSATTTSTTASTSTTTAPTPPAASSTTVLATTTTTDDDSSSSSAGSVVFASVVVVIAGGAAAVVLLTRRRRR